MASTTEGSREDGTIQNGLHPGDDSAEPKLYGSLYGPSKRIAIIKTCFISMGYLALGSWDGIISPSYIDLTEIFNCNIEQVSRAAMTKGFGIWAGTISGAIVADRFRVKTDIFLCVCFLVGGLACAAVPWSINLEMMAVFFSITGVCHATVQVSANVVVMSMWKEQASFPIHALLAMNALGYTVMPPIASVFLSPDKGNTTCTLTSCLEENINMTTSPSFIETSDQYISEIFKSLSTPDYKHSRVWIAYSICGSYAVLLSLVFLTFAIKKVPYPNVEASEQRSFRDMFRSWGGQSGSKMFYVYIMICAFLYFGINRLRVNCLQLFLFTIAVKTDNINMTKHMAALFLTTFRICFTCGRFFAGIISRFVSLNIIVMGMIFSQLAMHIIMSFFALESTILLWSLSCVIGLILGPTYPSAISWYNRYVEMTGLLVAVSDIGVGFGTMSSTWLSGFLFQYKGPEFIFYMLVAGGAAVCLVLVPLQIVFVRKGERFDRDTPIATRNIQTMDPSTNIQDDTDFHDDQEPLVA